MYYLIETDKQLERFFRDEGNECYLQFIVNNDKIHPKLQKICALYIYSFSKEKGFIINIDHPEAFPLGNPISYLSHYKNIFTRDKTKALIYAPNFSYIDIQSIYYLETNKPLPFVEKTGAHMFFEREYSANNVNKIIPLSKHYEVLEREFNAVKSHIFNYNPNDSIEWYNNIFIPTLVKLIDSGFKINDNFNKFFNINEKINISDSRIYGWYNYCTTTGRPANNFNSINFSALKHDNGERSSFEASNDVLIEMDFEGYHPRIIARLIGYEIHKDESIHLQLAEMYFETKDIDSEMYKKSKELTFKQMYGGIDKEYYKYEFFSKTKHFIDVLWQEFNTKGYIETPISKRKLLKVNYDNITPQKLFNYYIQAFETEYNFSLLHNVFKLLEGKKSKIILYVYDSILIDFSLQDGKELYQAIKNLISAEFPIKVKQGTVYSSLKVV